MDVNENGIKVSTGSSIILITKATFDDQTISLNKILSKNYIGKILT